MKGFGKKSISVLMTLVMLVGILADLRWGFRAVEVLADTTSSEITVSFNKLQIDIDGTGNGVQYEPGMKVPEGATFIFTLDWIKDSNAQQLPKPLIIELPPSLNIGDKSNVITDDGASNIGFYTIKNNVVEITYNDDYIKNLGSNVHGDFTCRGTLNGENVPIVEDGITEFKLYDKTIQLQVNNSTNFHQLYVQKSYDGAYDYDKGLTFKVQVSSIGTNKDVRIEDIFDTNRIDLVDVNSIIVTSNKQGNVKGTLVKNDEGFSYIFPDGYEMKDGETCTLSYTLKFNDKAFTSQYINGTNKVYAESESGKSNEATTWFNVDKTWVDKTGTYNKADGTVTWNIVINKGVLTDIAGTTLTDILPSEFKLNSDVTISGDDGFQTTIPKENAASGIQYTFPTDKAYTGTYTVTYTTTVTPNDQFNIITGGWSSNNTAQINSPKYGTHTDSANVYIPGIGNVLDKTHTAMREDFEHGRVYVDWRSEIKIPDNFPLDLTNFSYTDKLDMNQWNNQDHILVDGSVIVSGTTDYTINYVCGSDVKEEQSFSIEFGPSVKAGDTIVITYKSYFNLPAGNSTRWNIANTGTVNFGEISQSDTDTTSYAYVPAVSKSFNGTNDNTVFEWVVRINLKNAKLKDNDIIYVEETLPDNQKLVQDSLYAVMGTWAYHNEWEGGRSIDGITPDHDNEFRYAIDTKAVLKDQNDPDIIVLMYQTEIDDYKEYLQGGKKDYTNTVTVLDKEKQPVGSAEAKASNITPVPGKILNKNFEYTASTAPNVYYYIDVNTDGKTLLDGNASLTLTDTMGTALQYVPNSFKVYTSKERTPDSLLTTGWSMKYDPETNVITVTLPDSTPLYLAYQAKVTLKSGETLNSDNANNTVSLAGELAGSVSSSKPLYGSVIQSDVNVYSDMGRVRLYKHETGDIDSFIANAEYTATIKYKWVDGEPVPVTKEDFEGDKFKYYEPNKHYITGSDGWVFIDNLYPDMLYEIKEVAAPSGYKLNMEPVYYYIVGKNEATQAKYEDSDMLKNLGINAKPVINGQFIYVDDEVADTDLPTISIQKQDSVGSTALEGARLSLSWENTTNGSTGIVETWTTTTEAKTFSVDTNNNSTDSNVLKYGPNYIYTLHEISAPYGYSKAGDITFTLSYTNGKIEISNQNGGALSNENTMLTMTDERQILIQKIASDTNELLSNAELKLTKPDGTSEIWNTHDFNPKTFVSLSNGNYTLSEENVPGGYKKAADITFEVRNGEIVPKAGIETDGITLTMTDQALGKLVITKVDFVNNAPLAGAEFKLEDSARTVYTADQTATGNDGKITFNNLPYGTYILTETHAPTGYLVNQDSYTIEINKNTVERTITNTAEKDKTGTITITKKEADTDVTLSGAEFQLTNDQSDTNTKTYSATGTTNAKGVVVFENVPYGKYLLVENEAPFGYDKETIKVTDIDGNEVSSVDGKYPISLAGDKEDLSISFTATNEELKRDLTIIKKDENKHNLQGAIFELRKADGTKFSDGSEYLLSEKTGVNGTCTFKNLSYGRYILKETTAPSGYDIETAEKLVTIPSADGNDTVEIVEIQNNRKSIYIGKTAIDSVDQLPGAVFEICDASGNSLNPAITFTSDDKEPQRIYLGNNEGELKPGATYVLKETTAPGGYKKGDPIEFKISEDGKISIDSAVKNATVSSDQLTLTMKNEHVGKITLTKLDAFLSDGVHKPLPGAKFKIYKGNTEDPAKQITDGGDKDDGYSFTTDGQGKIEIPSLPYGTYLFVETVPPIDSKTNQSYEIITKETIVVLASPEKNVTVYNQLPQEKKVTIQIKKVDSKNNKGLEGAEFELYDANGIYITNGSSDKDGIVEFENIPFSTTDEISYTVKEIKAPSDYMSPDTDSIEISIPVDTVEGATIERTITNDQILVDIKIQKEDENKTPLSGASFTLYKEEDGTVVKDKNGKDCIGTTDLNGLTFEGIPYGVYVLQETEAPKHYSIDGDGKRTLYLNDETAKNTVNGIVTYSYKYNPITVTNKQNTIKISKQDINTHDKLESAELKLSVKDSNDFVTIKNGTQEFKIGTATDLKKYVLAPDVIYTLEEKEEGVPSGYLQAPPIEFEIIHENNDNDDKIHVISSENKYVNSTDVHHLIMYDEPYGKIQIKKVDAITGDPLNGVVFTLCDEDGNAIPDGDGKETRTTGDGGASGVVTFTKLPYGTYILKESKTPTGYLEIKEDIYVTVDENTVNKDLTVSREVANTPQTKVGDIKITKTINGIDTPDWNNLVFEFGLYKPTDLATPVIRLQTQKDGTVTFPNIPFGTYYIKEESAPFGYSSKPYSVQMTNGTKKTDLKPYFPKNNDSVFYEVVVGDGGTPTDDTITIDISVVDEKLKGSLQIKKIGSGTKEPIEGVVFNLYPADADGNQSSNDPYRENIITDRNGEAEVPDLEFGNYILTEKHTHENYILPTGTEADTPITIEKVEPTEVTITNEPIRGTFKIKKIDSVDVKKIDSVDVNVADVENVKGLPFAVYEIYNIKNESSNPTQDDLGNKMASGTTDSNGEYEFKNIPYGKYYLVEETAPQDYAIANIIEIEISDRTTLTNLTRVVDDAKLTGDLVIHKTDLDMYLAEIEYPLAKAEFLLLDSDGRLVIKGENDIYKETIAYDPNTYDKEDGIYRTDENGNIEYKNLPCGSYTLIEQKAPEYYTIITKEYDVYVNPSEQETETPVPDEEKNDNEKVVLNENLKFQISKKIKRGTSELPGATLQILKLPDNPADDPDPYVTRDSEGKQAELIWTTDGTAKLIGLGTGPGQISPGNYMLHESDSPKGYARVLEDLAFSVDEKGIIYKVGEWKAGADGDPDGEITTVYTKGGTLSGTDDKDVDNDKGKRISALVLFNDLAESVPPKTVRISKASAGGNGTVYGAQLWIWNADKTRVMAQLPVSGDEPYEITVGAKEEKTDNYTSLMYDEMYILEEVGVPEEPNDPYYAKADDIYFRIDFDGKFLIEKGIPEEYQASALSEEGTHLTMLDDRIIYISKKADGIADRLSGAKLELYEGTDTTIPENRVDSWISSNEEAHEITVGIGEHSIKFGTTYTLVETEPPTGYITADPISFSVRSDGTIVTETGEVSENGRELIMRDAVIGSKEDDMDPVPDAFTNDDGTPKTGDDTPLTLLIILVIAAAVVIAGLAVTGRRKARGEKTEDEEDEE